MALLTDSDFLTVEMLEALEPEVREVAESSSIAIDGENSIIRSAWDECSDQLLEHMDSFGGYINLAGAPQMGTMGSYGLGVSRPRVFLSQIVATESEYANRVPVLQRWMLYRALQLLYRTASQRTVHDRYQAKADEYAAETKTRWRSLWVKGLPIVIQPLAAPGAIHEFDSGSWSAANVSAVASGSSSAETYEIAITWVDGSRYVSQENRGNAESGPSEKITFAVPANNVLRLDITSLNPPTGKRPEATWLANGVLSPLAASGWNVYAGKLGATLKLQNASPIPVATKTYQFAGAPTSSGAALRMGQVPDANFAFERVLHRA